MTEINGPRLAYRGLVTGLAGGWVWAAAAMLGGLLLGRQPLLPLEVLGGGAGRAELAIGMVVTQLAAGGVGMGFAYFFARYFTVRGTLLTAAPCFALLAWLAAGTFLPGGGDAAVPQLILATASVLYGLLLGAGLPVRGQVQRQPSLSAST